MYSIEKKNIKLKLHHITTVEQSDFLVICLKIANREKYVTTL